MQELPGRRRSLKDMHSATKDKKNITKAERLRRQSEDDYYSTDDAYGGVECLVREPVVAGTLQCGQTVTGDTVRTPRD